MINIILVEDDEDDVYFFKAACKRLSLAINITQLQNGEELLEHIKNNDCTHSVILLDLNMPVMGGMQALEHLNQIGKIKELVIVTYTTSDNQSDIDQAYEYGVKSFVTKPANIEELSKFISVLTEYWFTHSTFPANKD